MLPLRSIGRWIWLAAMAGLAACAALPPGLWPAASPPPTPMPTPSATASPTPPPTPGPPTDLRVWVAASLGPEARPDAWKVLTRALDEFALRHHLTVEVRVKAEEGAGGLVETLVWSRVVAPEAAPDVILAPVGVLEAARVKAALPRLPEALHAGLRARETYPYAQAAAGEHDQLFAYPVAAEAPVLAWPRHAEADLPTTWAQWAQSPTPWTWAARDPWAWTAWALYQAAGGLPGPANQPALLQAEPLAEMLEFLVQARWNAGLRRDAVLWRDMDALWQAHGQDDIGLITWSSHVTPASDAWVWAPLPGPEHPGPLTMRVYAWAVATEVPARRDLAVEWLRRVTDAGWSGPWARAAGLWPTAPDALRAGWDAPQTASWDSWFRDAKPAPPLAVRGGASQALRSATLRVLAGAQTPLDAAYQALVDLGAAEPAPTPTATGEH